MRAQALLFLVMAAFFWGISVPISKIFLEEYPPVTVLLIQLFFSCAFVFGVASLRRNLNIHGISRNNLITIAAVGILEPGLAYFIGFYGLAKTTAINTGILQSMESIFIVILLIMFFNHILNRYLAFLVLLGLLGAIFTVNLNLSELQFGLGYGDALVLLAVFTAAVYVTLSNKFVNDYEPELVLFIQQLSSIFFVLSVAVIFFRDSFMAISITDLFIIGLAGIFQFGLTFLFFFIGMKHSHPFVSAVSLNLISIFAVISSILLLGELVQLSHVVGGAMTIASAVLISIALEKRERTHTQPTISTRE